MKLTLQIKLILAFTAVVMFAIVGVVLFANLDSERQVTNYKNRGGLFGVSELIEALEKHYETTGSWDAVETVTTNYTSRGGKNNPRGRVFELTLLDAKRNVVWSSTGRMVGTRLEKDEISDALILHTGSKVAGYLLVENASQITVDEITPFVSRLRQVLLYAGGLAILLAVGLAILLSNYLLKPVKQLTKASTELASGDFSTRVEARGNDEIALLGKTFNQMANNLELAEERKQSLTADVAHELRTPISVQKAQLEGMLDGVLPLTEENIGIALQQTNFLSRMVDDLRLLAMADAGEVRLEKRETDIELLVNQVAARFQAQAQQDGTTITTQSLLKESNKIIFTDPDRVSQILQNLIANALRYGKKGGNILITLKPGEENLAVSVKDDGYGIPETALPHLFERFYRHERARSRETGGTGLGLAISKKLAVLLGGDLHGANALEGGAVFVLELPTD